MKQNKGQKIEADAGQNNNKITNNKRKAKRIGRSGDDEKCELQIELKMKAKHNGMM